MEEVRVGESIFVECADFGWACSGLCALWGVAGDGVVWWRADETHWRVSSHWHPATIQDGSSIGSCAAG